MYKDSAALIAAQFKSKSVRANFVAGYRRDTSGWSLEREDQNFLRQVTTGRLSGRALLSNERVHQRAEEALVAALQAAYEANPNRQFIWITIACDTGLTWERAPVIDTVSLRNIASAHLRRCRLDGFGVLEIDIWKNFTGEPGRRVVPHVHFVAWSAHDANLDVEALQIDLCGRRALVNSLGAKPAVAIEITRSAADFERIGRYMFKRPAYAKNLGFGLIRATK